MTKRHLIGPWVSLIWVFSPACAPTTPGPESAPSTAANPADDPTPTDSADDPPGPGHVSAAPGRRTPARKLSKDARDILKVHNAARRAVGVGPLKWSPRLARYARTWANRLARLQTLQHRPPSGKWKQKYGENLAMAGGSAAIADYGKKGSLQWLGEKRRYRHGNRSLAGVGHYTQMVWRKTRTIGCALARYTKGPWKNVILVCNYDPPGNMMGESPY